MFRSKFGSLGEADWTRVRWLSEVRKTKGFGLLLDVVGGFLPTAQ